MLYLFVSESLLEKSQQNMFLNKGQYLMKKLVNYNLTDSQQSLCNRNFMAFWCCQLFSFLYVLLV